MELSFALHPFLSKIVQEVQTGDSLFDKLLKREVQPDNQVLSVVGPTLWQKILAE